MKKYIIILSLFLSSLTFSQNNQIDWLHVHNLTADGINELYNLNINKANELFNKVIYIAPGDPRGYFFNCILYYFRYSLERNRADFDKFFASSEKVIEVCENLINQNGVDYTSRFYLAGIYGYRGIMYQLDNSIVKAVWDGKKGYGPLKDIIKEKPDSYDAYMGTGLFDYLLSKIPSGYRWVLGILGYSGDKERGLKELKIAEEKGIYTRTEAAIYLSQFLYNEERYEEAFFYIKKLIKQYPENSLFHVLYANMEARINKPEYAILACKKAIEINNRKKIVPADELVYIVLANSLFLTNDFKSAAESYDQWQKKVNDFKFVRSYNFLRMGLTYDLNGDREKAIKAYKLIKVEDANDHPDDAFNQDLARFYVGNPPDENVKNVIKINNKFSLKRYDEAIEGYLELLKKPNLNNDDNLICLYNLGCSYQGKNMYQEALVCFNQITAIKPYLRNYLIPYSLLKKGQCLVKLGRVEEGKKTIENIFEYDNYYYKKRFESQVKKELNEIK